LPSRKAISLRARSISLRRRWRSASKFTTPSRRTNTSPLGVVAIAEPAGRAPSRETVMAARARLPITAPLLSSAAATAGLAGLTVTASSSAGEIRLSLRTVRIALTKSRTGAISRSASGSRPLRVALGNGAIMMDSPVWGRRCQSSSEMNGMNGWSSRRVASSVSTRVCWVTAFASGLSDW
jgi:hypothetical protein